LLCNSGIALGPNGPGAAGVGAEAGDPEVVVVIHGNALDRLPDSYRRYLERFFRDAFKLVGTPLRVELRSGRNPYAR
jgi:GTP-binding protein